MICSLAFFEFYSCFTYILPLLYPKHGTILFCLPLFFLFISSLFYSNSSPIRLLFALLHLNILPYINKKTSPFQFYSSPSRAQLQSFQPSFPPPFSFPNHLHTLSFIPISIPIKIIFLHHLNPFAAKAWHLYRAIAMTLIHKSSAIAT